MNDSSIFDVNKFLTQTTTEAAKRRTPLDPKIEYVAVLGEYKLRPNVQGKKEPSKVYNWLDFPVEIDLTASPGEPERVGQDKVALSWSTSLDFNATGIDWAPGRNGGLRMVREATGLNVAGKPFSLDMIAGRTVRVKIRHEEYPEGSGELQDRVASFAKV